MFKTHRKSDGPYSIRNLMVPENSEDTQNSDGTSHRNSDEPNLTILWLGELWVGYSKIDQLRLFRLLNLYPLRETRIKAQQSSVNHTLKAIYSFFSWDFLRKKGKTFFSDKYKVRLILILFYLIAFNLSFPGIYLYHSYVKWLQCSLPIAIFGHLGKRCSVKC